jgi:hypothetical protein
MQVVAPVVLTADDSTKTKHEALSLTRCGQENLTQSRTLADKIADCLQKFGVGDRLFQNDCRAKSLCHGQVFRHA